MICAVLVLEDAVVVKTVMHPGGVDGMKITCCEEDDMLVMYLADRPVVREVSQDWRTHLRFAGGSTVVETVILEASQCGAWPLRMEHKQAV